MVAAVAAAAVAGAVATAVAAQAKIFEVTPDKKVVWEYINPKFHGAHEIHILTTNGKPIKGSPLK